MPNKASIFHFADIEVREREFSIIRGGEAFPVEPKAFRVLLILLRNSQKLIAKEELLNAVWGDAAVTENSLTRSIALLRRLLGDDTHNPRYIETVATVGYRFVCQVQVSEDSVEHLEATGRANGLNEGDFIKTSANGADAAATTNPPAQIDKWAGEKEPIGKQTEKLSKLGKWLLPGAALLVAGLAVTIWYLHRPFPPLRVAGEYVQITHDGQRKNLVGTDGIRL